MSIPVPIRRGQQPQRPAPPPPDPVYALMAAAQMHSEGRLLANNRQENVEQNQEMGREGAEKIMREIEEKNNTTPPRYNWPSNGEQGVSMNG